MKPKEKADELINSFMKHKPIKLSDYSRIEYPTAKAFALFTIDEIIKSLQKQINQVDNIDIIYWELVKREIN